MSETATLTSKGQITIPSKIRQKLDLSAGMKMKFEVRDGEIVLLPEVEDPMDELRSLRKAGTANANRVIHTIERFETLQVLPVTAGVAKHGADLRERYYQRGTLEMSHADAIHLSTAVRTGCSRFYTGDPDFRSVEEIETEVI